MGQRYVLRSDLRAAAEAERLQAEERARVREREQARQQLRELEQQEARRAQRRENQRQARWRVDREATEQRMVAEVQELREEIREEGSWVVEENGGEIRVRGRVRSASVSSARSVDVESGQPDGVEETLEREASELEDFEWEGIEIGEGLNDMPAVLHRLRSTFIHFLVSTAFRGMTAILICPG